MEDDSLLIELLDKFQTGIMIISNSQNNSNEEEKQNNELNEVIFANSFIREIFQETFMINSEQDENQNINYLQNLKKELIKFRKWEMDKLSEITLYDSIFNNNNEDSIETYFSDYYMIYVKIKFITDYILISIDNFNDERVELRKKIIKSISFQHLTTIHHELNNPLNGLINTIEQVNSDIIPKINLSVFLIKRVIKKFILYSKSMLDCIQMGNNVLTIINLKFVIEKIINNMKILFNYKRIKLTLNEGFNLLNNYLYKCDEYYLKEYFKNILMYLYYIVSKDEEIDLFCKFEEDVSTPRLIISFKKNAKKMYTNKQLLNKDSFSKTIEFCDNLEVKETVKSLEITREILERISKILNCQILFDINDETYLEIHFEKIIQKDCFEQDSNIESDINEFSKSYILKVPIFGNYDTFKNLSNKGIMKNTKIILINEKGKEPIIIETKEENTTNNINTNKNTKSTHFNISMEQKQGSMSNKNLKTVNLFKRKSLKKIDDMVELSRDAIIDHLKTPKRIKFEKTNSFFHQKKFSTYLKKGPLTKVLSRNKSPKSILRSKTGITYYPYTNFSSKLKQSNNNNSNNSIFLKSTSKLNSTSKKSCLKKDLNNSSYRIYKKQENDILVVDDEEFNLNCMKNLLKLEKSKADYAINGEECLKKVIENPNYKLIFMDVYMPVMDGLEASQKIENLVNEGKVNKKIIIIIISAHSFESIQEQINKINIIKKFIQKPVTRKKIQSVLSDFYY